MNIIELRDVCYRRQSKNKFFSLDKINLTVGRGELVYLEGWSGAGKSTLIDLILGIRQPESGEISVFGSTPGNLKARFLTGVVLQKLRSPIKNAQLAMLADLIESHYPGGQGRIRAVLNDFDLKLSEDDTELAGGEERRYFIALAQAGSPHLLILDEPTTHLDSKDEDNRICNRTKLRNQLKKFVEEGNTVLLTSQDLDAESFFQPTKVVALKTVNLDPEGNHRKSFIENEKRSSPIVESIESTPVNLEVGISHWVYLLFKYVQFNIRQTLQLDQKYVWLTFIASILWALCISFASKLGSGEGSSSLFTIAQAYSFYLAMTAANSTGNIIAEERQNELLTRLLKILPLPPLLYLSAKVISSLVIIALLVLAMLGTTLALNVFPLSVFPSLAVGLILGTIPYLFLGLALGYLFDKPKTIQVAALIGALSLAIPVFSRSLLTALGNILNISDKLDLAAVIGDNIAAHSPIYHYIQLLLCLGKAPEYDQYFWLHISWLLWFTFITSLLALRTYWFVSEKEAKA